MATDTSKDSKTAQSKDAQKDPDKAPDTPDGVERRKSERRRPDSDRRASDRVVVESNPRRQQPGRRSTDK